MNLRRPTRALLALSLAGILVATACTSAGQDDAEAPEAAPVTLTTNVEDAAKDVPVDTIVTAAADGGTLTSATLATADGETTLEGLVDGPTWAAGERLEPDTSYELSVTGENADGVAETVTSTFTTMPLTLDQQTYPSVAPLEGETVGVGMPVIVTFDLPVKDRELYEQNMSVQTDPGVEGSWSWFSDTEVHFRPQEYWAAGTEVKVLLRLNSLPAGDGIYGQQDQEIDFTVGRKAVSVVDTQKHTLTFSVDDEEVRTIPVSTGAAGTETREGTKVIMEKFDAVDMDAATTGVDSEDPEYYDLEDVQWAMRVTNSGEFLHAAPWSVGSQGNENVSHGCVGMSTSDAKWVYDRSRRGDVIEFTGSGRSLEDRNGWTDWNVPWDEWTAGSALTT